MDYSLHNEILVGELGYPLYRFANESIVLNSLSGVFAVDPIGNELSVDTFTVTIRHDPDEDATVVYSPVGADAYESPDSTVYTLATQAGRDYMTELPYGTPVFWRCEGRLVAKGYLQLIERMTRRSWRLTMVSGVGLLGDSYHVGGIYSGQTFETVVADIIGGVFPFSVSVDLAQMPVFGWLPYDTRRANLHRLLVAYGANLIRRGDDVDYTVGWLESTEETETIPDSRISISGSTSYQLPATGVEITEHTFAETPEDETVQLVDTTAATTVGDQFVAFDAPCYDLTASGTLAIMESGVNYAIVEGVGVLIGKKYTHNTNVVSMSTGETATPRIKRITDNCLITAINVNNVASRVLAYYSSAKTVQTKLMLDGERPGAAYAFHDSFGDETEAYLRQIQLGITSIQAAACEFVEGYVPTSRGIYSHSVVLTGSGSWTPPEGVTECQAILIGGGSGGQSGSEGEYGYGVETWPIGSGAGGSAGKGGRPGKSFAVRIVGIAGSVAYGCGSGGASDTDGTATTFGGFSSASGSVAPRGVMDLMTGEMFALNGADGADGGRGAASNDDRQIVTFGGGAWIAGEQGLSYHLGEFGIDGGGGGGAAVGANGGDGSAYSIQENPTRYIGGAGGTGATPIAGADATVYGSGGDGGHGGGGGGQGGNAYMSILAYNVRGRGGDPGQGSQGGRGGDGCIIVYY